jgi:Ca-activated chloride channel family protein
MHFSYWIYNLLFVSLVIQLSTAHNGFSQSAHNFRRDADKKYTQGLYNEAEEQYRKSLEADPKMKAYFNLGNSLYQQQRYEEAREQYDRAIARTEDPVLQGKAYYNKGNSFFGEQKLQESIEMYKEAIRKNPADEAALQNLLLTKQLLRQQQQQQQDQQQQQQQQENNDDRQEQDSQDTEESDEQNEEKQDNQQTEQNEVRDSTENQTSGLDSLMQGQISREELMKLLKAIEEEDKKIQQKLRRGSGKKWSGDKDW